MITLTVEDKDIQLAKQMTADFDKKKTYNKFNSSNNYIGILGELLLDRYLTEQGIVHNWLGVSKGVMNSADFIIDNQTIDLKTTYSDSFWFQKPVHNIYIYAHLSKDNKTITYKAFITKEEIAEHIFKKTAQVVVRYGRVDYTLKVDQMHDLNIQDNKIIFK